MTGLFDDDHTQYFNQTRGDARYYTETEVDTQLADKSDVGHLHDARYYTETEVDAALAGKADTGHTHFDSGFFQGTTDSNARLIIPHGLGVTPTTVYAIADQSNASLTVCFADISQCTSTHINIGCRDVRDGALIPNNATDVHWIAIP